MLWNWTGPDGRMTGRRPGQARVPVRGTVDEDAEGLFSIAKYEIR
jgi:hypothetical protein